MESYVFSRTVRICVNSYTSYKEEFKHRKASWVNLNCVVEGV